MMPMMIPTTVHAPLPSPPVLGLFTTVFIRFYLTDKAEPVLYRLFYCITFLMYEKAAGITQRRAMVEEATPLIHGGSIEGTEERLARCDR